MPAKPAKPKDNSAAIAAKFGTSLKALRLYEQLGMLTPMRTKAGWRVFQPADIERLHAILSLKQLGLPLARIAELLKAGKADLSVLLSVQEEVLARNKNEVEHALTLIRIAKERLRGKESLSADELATLVRKISATVLRWTPELSELAKRSFTPEQMTKMRSTAQDPAAAAQISADWERIQAELAELVPLGDPQSEAALAFGRRLTAKFRDRSGGDKQIWNANAQFWQQAVETPAVVSELRLNRDYFAFVAKVLEELKRRGEMEF